jgi:hypothetical protein
MKQRSTFWVVSTHVLTTGLAMPAVAGIVAWAILEFGNIRDPLTDLAVRAACALAGYLGGVYYSLSFLRSAATHERWTDCTRPSIIAFSILELAGFAVNVMLLRERDTLSIGILGACYAGVMVGFAWITSTGFARLAQTDTKSRAEPPVSTPEKEPGSSRVLWGCICFAACFAVGMGMAIQLDGKGLQPPDGWRMRLLIGSVVGGIGALLGMISGPTRL